MGIKRVSNCSPCLILVMRVERSLLMSASGARLLDRMSMELQSNLDGCMYILRPRRSIVHHFSNATRLQQYLTCSQANSPTPFKEKETHWLRRA
eukprot:1150416-Pelagomonas_calceolata.AAC.8